MIIRNEKKSDIDVISEVTIAAFRNCPYGNHTEQFIISALRAANALAISLVAEIEGKVVGHINPVRHKDCGVICRGRICQKLFFCTLPILNLRYVHTRV